MNKYSVIVGENERAVNALSKRGIECFTAKPNYYIEKSVQRHGDLACFVYPDGKILLDKSQNELGMELTEKGYSVGYTQEAINSAFPKETALCAVSINGSLICSKYTEKEITSAFTRKIQVKQGYVRCSVCVLNNEAFITDDESIYKACKEQFKVLLVRKGDVVLEGKSYGFIGGASGKIGDRVYFFGDIKTHGDYEKINRFFRENKVEYECLFDGKLIDVGSVIQLFDKQFSVHRFQDK